MMMIKKQFLFGVVLFTGIHFSYAQAPSTTANPPEPAAADTSSLTLSRSLWQDATNDEVKTGVQGYIEHVASCTAGDYPVVFGYSAGKPVTLVFKIQGWGVDNKCAVNIFVPQVDAQGNVGGVRRSDCKFNQAALDKQVKQFNNDYKDGNFHFFLDSPIGTTLGENCALADSKAPATN